MNEVSRHPAPGRPAGPALQRLRDDLSRQAAPADLWGRIAGALPPAPPLSAVPRPAVRRIAWPTLAGWGAAAFGVWLVWLAGPAAWLAVPSSSGPARPSAPSLAAADRGGSGFVPVASPERLAQLWQGGAQAAPAWVVRTELPRERLAALGLPYDPARAGELVHAELLMHPAGDVLAVRVTR